jgi:TolB-like protein/DNA-binding winged helix-turn-helix (wHTH) protein
VLIFLSSPKSLSPDELRNVIIGPESRILLVTGNCSGYTAVTRERTVAETRPAAGPPIRFGVFELDPGSGELRKAGILVHLPPQPARVLAMLASHPGEIITRNQIREQLWDEDTHVDFDHGLNQCIAQIRGALSDDAGTPRYVQTLPRRGYRFVARVERNERPQATNGPGAPVSPARRRRWYWLLSAAVAVAACLPWLYSALPGWWGGPSHDLRLAVLPFVNLSGDPGQEYLSDGLTQEMISQLGRVHPAGLNIIARTSIMRYKNVDGPVEKVGRELGVDYVLTGSTRREGDRIRISAELIRVRDHTQLWSETYERELASVLAVHSEVARRVASSLALRLLPEANLRLVNPEAYEAYLKGLQHWYQLTPSGMDAALQYFESALRHDPQYAPAFVGISLVWVGRAQMGFVPRDQALPPIRTAALKALELDDRMVEAHYALALIKTWYEFDWAGSEYHFKRAIELNPSFPDARAYYSHFLLILRRPGEAVEQMARALELDPFNVLFQSLNAGELTYLKRCDEAIVQAREALAATPNHPLGKYALVQALECKGLHEEMVEAARNDLKARGDSAGIDALDQGYRQGGYRAAWRSWADSRAAVFPKTRTGAMLIVQAYVSAGEDQLALDWLETSYEFRDPNLPYAFIKPKFDRFHAYPRFQTLRRKMNLPEPPSPPKEEGPPR